MLKIIPGFGNAISGLYAGAATYALGCALCFYYQEVFDGHLPVETTGHAYYLSAIAQIQKSAAETAKIIKVIDEIAFQTNLLALNAAVDALLYHAWVGVKDIWMDYVKPVWVRLLLQTLTALWLVGCAAWSAQILWRV